MSVKNIREIKPKDFPPLLKEITDPPEKLYVQGVLPDPNSKYLCVVGSRKYTEYGKEACEKLVSGLRGYDISIISGLALGIDSIAHRAALSAGLKTFAVPGSGLGDSVLYPSANRNLAGKILEAGGGLLSEFEKNFRPTQWSFPQRNRIMAGMSNAVLVIEAELRSGTLITSKLATEYNRDVLTVPGPIFSSNSDGPNMLLKLGAAVIRNSGDILEALDIKEKTSEEIAEKNYDDCSDEEKKILEILKNPLPRDELLRKCGMPASQANIILSMMEIKGLLKESLGEIHRA